ncbi:alpha/beta hydrolase [Saccharibacillus alkalitolerans]|uniref:Alpha/beta hydrolase fold domain-containing protein n=1 Tax=Saccharibacillus alkalitolerans TaxID=2705290 RepID=A0ABX0F3D2_9BACL|nr:alpha/beta hydrolase fold domain-containing protein [Saccharibacillus alkalitolerans]NGZ75122.1 alpha/beta hydrolase fold domain-containing protein [Saccharibacillus alkalitolerans]
MGYTGRAGFSSSAGGGGSRLRKWGRMLLLAGNLISLALGIIYLFEGRAAGWWNLYGLLMLLTLLGNLHLAMGRGLHRGWEYAYLALHALGMIAVPLLNTAASSSLGDHDSRSVWSAILMLALFALGAAVAFLRWRSGTEDRGEGRGYAPYSAYGGSSSGSGRLKKTLKALLTLWFLLNFAFGVYVAAILLGTVDPGLLEVVVPEYALFFGLMVLGAAALLVKMYGRSERFAVGVLRAGVRCIGLFVLIVCLLPLASAPKIISEAKEAYTAAFGADPLNAQDEHFMKTAFLLPDYFYGAKSEDYRVQPDIVYYEGKEGVDAGVKLAFDAYMPPEGAKDLPGQGSVLIRIHGGGWTIGDKGAGNYAQMNKHFASQGYVVFDVQYGLSDQKKFVESAPVPEQVVGSFNIDDMLRHIGLFTTYMADHAEEYGANTESVFLSGGSAGGQLAAAAGLAPYAEGFGKIIDPRITVKGIIPYYPANGLAADVGITGSTDELADPALLVNEDSPPALIYQGQNDGIVDPEIARTFVRAYRDAGNDRVALVEMPFGTHGSDIYYASYYNEPFTYMMERFMSRYK